MVGTGLREGLVMAVLIYPLLGLAVVGFFTVLVIHVAALLGTLYPFEHLFRFLGAGLFVVWFPTVLVSVQLARDFKQKDVWRASLRGCPKWLQRALWIMCGYAWVGFFTLPVIYGGGGESPANTARTMSGGLLAFYSIAACVLYSATKAPEFDKSRHCLNGHHVSPLAKYCEECGAAVQTVLRLGPE
jgi:hypothetical protein